jgi:hypothetical protein
MLMMGPAYINPKAEGAIMLPIAKKVLVTAGHRQP